MLFHHTTYFCSHTAINRNIKYQCVCGTQENRSNFSYALYNIRNHYNRVNARCISLLKLTGKSFYVKLNVLYIICRTNSIHNSSIKAIPVLDCKLPCSTMPHRRTTILHWNERYSKLVIKYTIISNS